MKNILSLFSMIVIALLLNAQTSIPTTWDFAGSTPTGWTLNGTDFYNGSPQINFGAPACKLNSDNDNVEIWAASEMGPVTYYMIGTGVWEGVFSVQESVNGSSWTDMRVFDNSTTQSLSTSAHQMFIDTPDASSRFVRWFYTDKISGSNAGLDDISIANPLPKPEQEIFVEYSSSEVLAGGQVTVNSPVLTSFPFSLDITNLGTTDTLFLTAPILTGSGDFSLSSWPNFVGPQATESIDLDFTPSTSGTILADITINSNDADEATYPLNLYGIGGNLASEPTMQPVALNFSNNNAWNFEMNFSDPATPAEGYIVLRQKGSAVSDMPVDGVEYSKGSPVGASKVFHIGDAGSYLIQECVANTEYHFAAYAYNGFGTFTNYNTTSPLTGSTMTLDGDPGSYYGTVDPASMNFISALNAKINPHTQIFYSNYRQTVIENFYERDTTGDLKALTALYSGEIKTYTPPFDFTSVDMSREHAMASSWFPSAGNTNTIEYSDYHNLHIVEQSNTNSDKSNNPLGNVLNVIASHFDGKLGTDANGTLVYEPRDEFKGDVARSLFYMTAAYDEIGGDSWAWDDLIAKAKNQDQWVLKQWHFDDPPSPFEIARHEYLASLQNNRNPFIDNPEWVCYIDFEKMTYIVDPDTNCTNPPVTNSTDELEEGRILISPNPSNGEINIDLSAEFNYATISIFNLTGTEVYSKKHAFQNGTVGINLKDKLASGSYLLVVNDEDLIFDGKLVIE